MIRFLILPFVVLVSACTTSRQEGWYPATVKSLGGISQDLSLLVGRIEVGDTKAWNEFSRPKHLIDGENALNYSYACAELQRRDPTIFLRKYLQGDERAIELGHYAYLRSDPEGRSLADAVYKRRLDIASDRHEWARISTFIRYSKSGA